MTGPDDAQREVRERAVLATRSSVTVADARAPDAPLTWVNPAFTATTGYSFDDAVGRNCRFLQGPETDPEAVALLHHALHLGQAMTITLLNYRKDGTTFWNELAVSPMRDGGGTLTHFAGIQTDVTRRVLAEQQRAAALQAERTARTDAELARADATRAQADAVRSQLVAEHALAATERLGLRLALVADATSLLAGTLDVAESLNRLSGLLVPRLADWVVLALPEQDSAVPASVLARHRDGQQEQMQTYRELLMADDRPTGQPWYLRAVHQPLLQTPLSSVDPSGLTQQERAVLDLNQRLGATSALFVPLVARGRALGAMMLVRAGLSPVFDRADLDTAADLGRRAGLALDNARLYTRERSAALALQQALLPHLPQLPGLALAARYLPASRYSQVGGDWWDVFALPDGATALTVGDVMGHDIGAAAAMGQLRSVLRTCAWAGEPPAHVMRRMDQLVQGFDMAQLATCVYARLQYPDAPPGRRRSVRLRWSNAGHLPPVLLTPDGRAELLTGPIGVPLGVPSVDPRTHSDLTLPAGSTLLLYTDGLVETRHRDIDDDLARLLDTVRTHQPTDGPQALVDRLAEKLENPDDDVAVLAVQVLRTHDDQQPDAVKRDAR